MRRFTTVFVVILAMGMLAGTAMAGKGAGNSNSLRAQATPVELDPGDVEILESDTDADNFEEEFTYYVVRHGIEYEEASYRGPARLGPENHVLGGSDAGSFWFGVSAPDPEDGIQSEIVHKGQENLYMKDSNGDWHSLKVQFNGKGELLHVNGEAPQ